MPPLDGIGTSHASGDSDRGSSGDTGTSYASNDNSNYGGSSFTGDAGADNSGSWGMSLGNKGKIYGGLGMIMVGGIATLATGGMGPAIGIAIAIGGDVLIYNGTKGAQNDAWTSINK